MAGQLGINSPAALPSSSDAREETPQSSLGMVRLVEVVLEPGKRACPPLSSAGAWSGDHLSPGYAGAEVWGFTPLQGTRTDRPPYFDQFPACFQEFP